MNQLKGSATTVRLSDRLKTLVQYYSNQFKVTQSEFIRDSIMNQIDRARNKAELK